MNERPTTVEELRAASRVLLGARSTLIANVGALVAASGAIAEEAYIVHECFGYYRPQTSGKVERFWRTLDDDVIEGATFDNLDHFASELFEYIVYYNNHRPHQALAGQTPKAFAATKTTAIQSANY